MTDFGGRIDHTLSQIDTLFKRHVPDHVNVYLRSHHTLAWLLLPGQHEILVPHEFVTKQFWCSYVAINGNCNVTTNGLKWDLCTFHHPKCICVMSKTSLFDFILQRMKLLDLVKFSAHRIHTTAQKSIFTAIIIYFGPWELVKDDR